MFSHLDDDLCVGLNDCDEVIIKSRDECDDSQLWQWQDGTVCINKLGKVLDVEGCKAERGKFKKNTLENVGSSSPIHFYNEKYFVI